MSNIREWRREFAELGKLVLESLGDVLLQINNDKPSGHEASPSSPKKLTSPSEQSTLGRLLNIHANGNDAGDEGVGAESVFLTPAAAAAAPKKRPVVITPIGPANGSTTHELDDDPVMVSTKVLRAGLLMPLYALGLTSPHDQVTINSAPTDKVPHERLTWWLNRRDELVPPRPGAFEGVAVSTDIFMRLWGQWIVSTIIPVWLKQDDLTKAAKSGPEWVDRCLRPYFFPPPESAYGCHASWHSLVALLGRLVSHSDAGGGTAAEHEPGALVALFSKMVDHGAASPTLALERISTLSGRNSGFRDARLMQMQWHDYLAVVCSIPDKLASLYEATSLPALLVPDRFYKKMMLDTLRGLDKFASDMPSPMEGTKFLGQLVSKICRVGYHASVAQVFDAYCAKSLASCLENTSELDVLSKCNMAKGLLYLGSLLDELPSWELARLWSSFLDHWSRPVLGLTSKDDVFSPQLRPWTRRVAAAVQALWGRVVVAAAATTRRGDAQSSDVDHGRLSMLVSQFTVAAYPVPLFRALVLGIQLAFGADDNSSNDDALLGIARSLIRQWGRPNFVRSGRIEVVKSLTALIVLCVGCLPATLVLDLSGDIGFAGAVPRYFSSPTSTTRVLGIIVAETVTRKAFAVRSGDSCGAQRADPEFADSGAMNLSDVDAMDINVPAEDPSAALDFGLDDILAQAGQETASGTLGRRLRQEAEEIELMRALCRPIPEQLDAMVVGMAASAGSCGPGQQPVVDSISAATAAAVAMFSDQPDPDTVYDRRPQSLADPEPLRSDFVKPRRPTFVRQVLQYFDAKDDALKVEAGLEACVRVVESADIKELGEVGLQLATRLVHLSNPGPDARTLAWDTQRLKSLSALTCRIPGLAGPFLSRICFDRELSVVQRELILAALATVAMNMSGLAVEGDPPRDDGGSDLIRDLADRIEAVRIGDGGISAGKVVRRSRKLDILHSRAAGPDLAQEKRQRWNHLSGPCFFFPLVAQFEYRTVVPDGRIDVRTEMLLLSKYFNTLAIIVYTSGASVHRLKMDQELWDAVLSMRQFPELSDHTEILETVLFCLEVLISADRPLNTETLVREFGPQLTGTLDWVHELVQRRVLGPDTNSRAGRLVARISEVFDEHKAKAISRLTNTGDVVYL